MMAKGFKYRAENPEKAPQDSGTYPIRVTKIDIENMVIWFKFPEEGDRDQGLIELVVEEESECGYYHTYYDGWEV
jgi:hypothetical protein